VSAVCARLRPIEGCAQPSHCDTLTDVGSAYIGVRALDVIFATNPTVHMRSCHLETLPSWANSEADYARVLMYFVHCRQVTGSFNSVFTVEWPKSLVQMWSWAGTVMPPPSPSSAAPLSCGLSLSHRHDFLLINVNTWDQNVARCASHFWCGW
jgi:hypothetical protein